MTHTRSRRRLHVVACIVALSAGIGTQATLLVDAIASSTAAGAVTVGSATTLTSVSWRRSVAESSTNTPLSILSITPANGARAIGAVAPITINFSAAIAANSPLPSLNPSTTGAWTRRGTKLIFTPTTAFIPLSQVTVTVPPSVTATDGATLTRRVSATFKIRNGSVLRLQQLLSMLAYSPLAWRPSGNPISVSNVSAERASLFAPPPGTFTWEQRTWPSQLLALWVEGRYSIMTRGLVMSFQADHALNVNGQPTAGLWNDLLGAITTNARNTGGYNFALANQARPQSLTIWHDGNVVLRAPANTGISASPTPDGVFPVFARYRNQVMTGHNPNGSAYADPVQYVAYFHSGDAVHYLPRASYGIPQSLGCVELSLTDAASAWPWLAYGTPVVVIN